MLETSNIQNEASQTGDNLLRKEIVKKLKKLDGSSVKVQNQNACISTTFKSETPTADTLQSLYQGSIISKEKPIFENLDEPSDQINSREKLTLGQIISDTKFGIPSVAEERAKQQKILKIQAKKRANKEGKEVQYTKTKQQKINSASFSNRSHTKKWNDQETRKFYKCLQQFGTDFALISKLFPNRSRKQIKNKFRKIERENAAAVEQCLCHNRNLRMKTIDSRIKTLKQQLNCGDSLIEERCQLLMMAIKQRKTSFKSIDSADVHVVEEVDELFRNVQKLNQIDAKEQSESDQKDNNEISQQEEDE